MSGIRVEVAAAFKAAAKELGVGGKELSDLLRSLSRMSEEELVCFPTDADNEAIIAYARSSTDSNTISSAGPAHQRGQQVGGSATPITMADLKEALTAVMDRQATTLEGQADRQAATLKQVLEGQANALERQAATMKDALDQQAATMKDALDQQAATMKQVLEGITMKQPLRADVAPVVDQKKPSPYEIMDQVEEDAKYKPHVPKTVPQVTPQEKKNS